jgi:hypothetical protein
VVELWLERRRLRLAASTKASANTATAPLHTRSGIGLDGLRRGSMMGTGGRSSWPASRPIGLRATGSTTGRREEPLCSLVRSRSAGRRDDRLVRAFERGSCTRSCGWVRAWLRAAGREPRAVATRRFLGAAGAGLLAGAADDELGCETLESLSVALLSVSGGRRPSGST